MLSIFQGIKMILRCWHDMRNFPLWLNDFLIDITLICWRSKIKLHKLPVTQNFDIYYVLGNGEMSKKPVSTRDPTYCRTSRISNCCKTVFSQPMTSLKRGLKSTVIDLSISHVSDIWQYISNCFKSLDVSTDHSCYVYFHIMQRNSVCYENSQNP